MPHLKKINLAKGEGHHHPDIEIDKSYLCKVADCWYAGRFSVEWYGLSFEGWGESGLQYDKPGTNASIWQEVYEIVE